MQPCERPYSVNKAGVRLRVRLTPRASRDGADGLVQDSKGQPLLQVRLKAPPIEGAANKALVNFLASGLKLRKGDVEIVAGAKSRVKTVQLSGEGSTLEARLNKIVQEC